MITDAFDGSSPAIIQPPVSRSAPVVDAGVVTFSDQIERFALQNYPCEKIGEMLSATGPTPVYRMPYKGKTFAFYKTYVGAPVSVGLLFEKRRAEGCISVEMECAGLQALCDFRGFQLCTFFTSGDLLDAPEWDMRCKAGETEGTRHDTGHLKIALELALYAAGQADRAGT